MKLYGPYLRPDGRKHVLLIHDDGRRQTKSYPRYLLEQHLGRELEVHETVDHIDNDFTNDSLDNLQILSRGENVRKSIKPTTIFKFICPQCKIETQKPLANVKHNWKLGKSGPYCGKRCAGLASHE